MAEPAPQAAEPAQQQAQAPSKPRVLVLGGCGFIGRNLVTKLVEEKLCSFIKVVDKALPATSYFNEQQKAAFDEKDVVKFQQADLSKDAHVEKAFNEEKKFDYVFNLCGETRFALSEEEYKKKIVEVAIKCGTAAAAHGVKKFVEVSDARIYQPDKGLATEATALKPWTTIATFRLKAEEELAKIKDLPLVILRPAIVYGRGDLTGLTPRITCAAVYKMNNKKMKFLWDKDLKLNVVHVTDVCNALLVAATDAKPGSVYNLSDGANLDQGQLNQYLGSIFKIETGFLGSVLSNLARVDLQGVADSANDEHVPGWSKLCQQHQIGNTPLSPYIDIQLLKNNNLGVDGSKITKELNFKYQYAANEQLIRDQIDDFVKQKLFPPVL